MWFVYGWSTVSTSRNEAGSKRPVDGSIGELGDDGVAGAVDVVDVGEIGRRMEGETEQPLLAVGARAVGDVEHDVGAFVGHGDDPAGLLDDVDLRVAGTMGHIDRLVERADVEQRHGRFHERRGNGRRRRGRRSPVGGRVVGSVGGSVASTVVDGMVSAAVGGGPDPNESSGPPSDPQALVATRQPTMIPIARWRADRLDRMPLLYPIGTVVRSRGRRTIR